MYARRACIKLREIADGAIGQYNDSHSHACVMELFDQAIEKA